MRIRRFLLSTTFLSGIGMAAVMDAMLVEAADMPIKAPYAAPPAVDGINSKFDVYGGAFDDKGIYNARGALTIPLQGPYGVQIDGSVGSHDGDFVGAVGGHWFWRDPSRGMLGVYASYTHWDRFGGLHATHVAVEGGAFRDRWSLEGIAGVEAGNKKSSVSPVLIQTYDIDTRFFDKIDLSYYLQDNLKLSIGHRYLGGKHAAALGAEYAFALAPRTMGSVFVEGRVGEGNYRGVWGGLKVYYGQREKTLIQRHRQDDPPIWIPETLFTILNSFGKACLPTTDAGPDSDGVSSDCPSSDLLTSDT